MKKNCRLCDNKDAKFLFKKGQLEFFGCPYCKLVFASDAFSQAEIKDLYRYYAYKPQPFNPINEKRYLSLLFQFEPFKKNGRLLDVGCGGGHFISVAQDNGWEARGTEISEEAVRLCQEKDLKAYCGDISELHFGPDYFDVITMFEVIEHIYDPENTLRHIQRLLRRGGMLYITTPNFNSLTRFILGRKWRVFHIEHIYYFTSFSIVRLLKRIGFSKVKVKSGNLSIIEIKSGLFSSVDKVGDERDKEQILRNKIENSRFLGLSKSLCNIFLNLLKLGDTLYVYAEK